ncbi:MAG: cytochrome c-type biogenesis protein [Halioglobus sp.]
MTRWVAILFLALLARPGQAVIETYEFSDPLLEERYQELSAELRCPKCQNQNIADSNAPIAQDLRKTLHRELESGASDQEILDYMVARYGEFVRYRPRFGGAMTFLWLFPVLLLVLGLLVLVLNLRRSRGAGEAGVAAGLTEQEQAGLDQLLAQKGRDS